MAHDPEHSTDLITSNQQHQTVLALPIAPLFMLGQVVGTPAALAALQAENISPLTLLCRHVTGDWGDLDKNDKLLNELAIRDGSRIFSAYEISKAERVWLITEADRSATTFLLPSEY